MKRTQLRSKEVRQQLQRYNFPLGKKDQVELVEEDDCRLIFINRQPAFFYHQDLLAPTLKCLQGKELLPKILVDPGAVKFIVGGADVMRPGIRELSGAFGKGDFVVIVDAQTQNPLAVGIALFPAEEMRAMTSGKTVQNIHHLGDKIWRMKL